jgi:DNA repair exonuclease SbcCD ATPase subunit
VLNLKKLYITAFGRFVDTQVIEFDHLGNLVQVDGQNNNSGGSSGAAKSTIFNAMDYLLGLNDIPNSVLQSRLTKEPILVEGEFTFDGRPLKIIRGRNKFFIELDGIVTTGSAKLTEEKLDQILAMPRNLFRAMLHKRQKEGGFFLQMTPAKIHEFLMDCSNLSEMRIRLAKLDSRVSAINDRKSAVEITIGRLLSYLEATRAAVDTLGPAPARNVDEGSLELLRRKADGSTTAFVRLIEKHKQEEAELEARRPMWQASSYDRSRIDEYKNQMAMVVGEQNILSAEEEKRRNKAESDLKELHAEQYRLMRSADASDQFKQEAMAAALQIRSIQACVCPTCSQSWSNDHSKAKELELMGQLKAYKDKIAEGDHAKAELQIVKQKIEDTTPYTKALETDRMKFLQSRRVDLMSEIANEERKQDEFNKSTFGVNNAALKEFSDRQTLSRERNRVDEDRARGQANLDKLAFDAATNSLKTYEQAKAKYDETLSSLKHQELRNEGYLRDAEGELASTNYQLKMAEESKKVIKSYISCSFDDSLIQIGEMATTIIRKIPNMANATIQLEGTRETQEGKIKEEVNAVISVDGELGVPIKSLSGGERSAVDLAIDLAVIDLIEQKTGKGINVFILDEPFTGLDTVSIEMTLEMLKNSNLTKKLILVDHNPVIREMVENRITVIRDGLTSRIVQ